MGQFIRNLKIQYKVALIFIVVLILMINLGALSITSIDDIRGNTDRVTNQLIPKLITTSRLKDSLNTSIAAAHDYVRTGNQQAKELYQQRSQEAVQAQVDLFLLSRTQEDFEFTRLFQDSINSINAAQEALITSYESGDSAEEVEEKTDALLKERDAFVTFLDTEVQDRIQKQAQIVERQSQEQLSQTIVMVILAGVLALITMFLLFSFVRRSITTPINQLTRMAENIRTGNFSTHIAIDSSDELGILAKTFSSMSVHIQKTQSALEQELEKTKQLDQQKTEFLSIAAHQLRTPMSGIKWVVQMALDGDFGEVSDEARDQLKKSMENIDRMIALINSLLDVTRLQTQGFTFSFKEGDILSIIHEAEEELYQAAEKNQVTITVVPPHEPLPKVRVDKEKIGMVIYNLMDNAVKYTPKGGRVTVGVQSTDEIMTITVADTGYGIPKSEQSRIFSKFYRGSNIQTVQADGSGLGLFMVHEIVKQHGGDVSFVSEANKGTTFTIHIPVNGPNSLHPSTHSDAGVDPEHAKKREAENAAIKRLGEKLDDGTTSIE